MERSWLIPASGQNLVTQFVSLSLHVSFVVRIWVDFYRKVFHYLQTVSDETHTFLGIIAYETKFGNSKVAQDLCTHPVVSLVHLKAQVEIRFHRIHSILLSAIGL